MVVQESGVQLSDFLSAGFLVTREVERPPYLSADLLPSVLVSASSCIAAFAPDTWCIEWTQDTPERRTEDAEAFGLNSGMMRELTAWVTPQFDKTIHWPNVISNLDTANELVERFLVALGDVRVLELALHVTMVNDFCREAEPPPQKPGFAPNGRQGVHEMLLKGNAPRSGTILGFEPLVFDYSLSCSWLCNGLETVTKEALRIEPNEYGLLASFEDAGRCTDHISRDDVGAEPGLWLPWLLVDHTQSQQLPAANR